MSTRHVPLVFIVFLVSTPAVRAQSFDIGGCFVGSQWSEFEGTDHGIGGRLSWQPGPVGLEGELNWYPADFPGGRLPFSGNRLEGLVAVTAGPRLNRARPFVRAGAGFLRSSAAPEPFACIAIFPPPLNCLLAAGHTMPAFDPDLRPGRRGQRDGLLRPRLPVLDRQRLAVLTGGQEIKSWLLISLSPVRIPGP